MCNAALSGTWYYSAQDSAVINAILTTGWRPDLITNTMYGTAVYLCRCNWYGDRSAPEIVACELDVPDNETMLEFDSSAAGLGHTDKHLREYWRAMGVPCFKTPQKGTDTANCQRRDHFLNLNIKAIAFEEYSNLTVVAVYDRSIIRNARRVNANKVPPCPVPLL